MFDYNKILEIKKINLSNLDSATLIDWEILELGYDELEERNWLCVEVWLDEDNAIKILQQSDTDAENIGDRLTNKQRDHIYKLVDKAIKEIR